MTWLFVGKAKLGKTHKIGMQSLYAALHQCMIHIAMSTIIIAVYQSRLGSSVELSLQCHRCEMSYYIRYSGRWHKLYSVP